MLSIQSRFVIGPSNILSAGVCMCALFSPEILQAVAVKGLINTSFFPFFSNVDPNPSLLQSDKIINLMIVVTLRKKKKICRCINGRCFLSSQTNFVDARMPPTSCSCRTQLSLHTCSCKCVFAVELLTVPLAATTIAAATLQ